MTRLENASQAKLIDCFEEYIKERTYGSHLAPETIRGYSAVFNLFLRVMPEVTDFDMLSREMLVEFFKRIETRDRIVGRNVRKVGVKVATIKTYRNKLNCFFEWLRIKGGIEANPFRYIKAPVVSYADIRAIGDTDIRKLYSAVTLHSPNALILRRDTAMISLLAFCGLRLGEFISLEVGNIDFEKRLLTVHGNTSKSKKTRYVPIHPTLLLHLRDYISERNRRGYKTPFLIVSYGSDNGLTRHGLKHWIKSMRRKSGVQFHLHQFRHAFACSLADKNVHAIKIQRLLGHSSLDMTMSYLRSLGAEDMHEEINKLSF